MCQTQFYERGILSAKSFYGNKRKWHFYWPSKQSPETSLNAAQIVSSCFLRGGSQSALARVPECQNSRIEFAFWPLVNDGKIENPFPLDVGGTHEKVFGVRGHFLLQWHKNWFVVDFSEGTDVADRTPRLWFRFQSNLWPLQVQVNMCDKRPYEARNFSSPSC